MEQKGRGWHRLPEEKKAKAIEDYKSGKNILQIAQEVGMAWETVKKVLVKSGVEMKKAVRRNEVHPEDRDLVVADYRSGLNSVDLAKKYNVTQSTISRIVKAAGATRSNSESKRKLSFDETAFDAVTDESAYWIGFLMADGCVVESEGHSPAISLGLAAKDSGHVEKFKAFLKAGHAVLDSTAKCGKYGTFKASRFSIRSKKLAEALAKYGVLPRKSHRAKVVGLENNPHFWRGVVDGDGCIHARGTPGRLHLILLGSKELLDQFKDFASSLSPRFSANVVCQKNIHRLPITGVHAMRVIKALYENAPIALERKVAVAHGLMADPYYDVDLMESLSQKYIPEGSVDAD